MKLLELARRAGVVTVLLMAATGFAQADDVTAPAEVVDVAVNPSVDPADLEISWSAVTVDASGNPETGVQYNIYEGPDMKKRIK